jgi:hypothetical protein
LKELYNNIKRTTSSFDISIATGLALESVFEPTAKRYDVNRVIPNKVNLAEYDNVAINMLTLSRNIISSFAGADVMLLDSKMVNMVLEYEIERLKELFQPFNIGVLFYYPEYLKVKKSKNILIQLRSKNTSKQILEHDLTVDSVTMAVKNGVGVKVDTLPVSNTNTLLFTSYPIDLVNHSKFKKLTLLESTTGILRDKDTYYHRYYNGKTLYPLPFYANLLVVFGDNAMFKPADIKIRTMITELAIRKEWTPFTTADKIKHDVNTYIPDKYLVSMFNLVNM